MQPHNLGHSCRTRVCGAMLAAYVQRTLSYCCQGRYCTPARESEMHACRLGYAGTDKPLQGCLLSASQLSKRCGELATSAIGGKRIRAASC